MLQTNIPNIGAKPRPKAPARSGIGLRLQQAMQSGQSDPRQ